MKKVILAVALVGLLAGSALADYAVGFSYGGYYGGPVYYGPAYTYYQPYCGPYYHHYSYGYWSPGFGFTYYHR